jgi:hypothetical protein
MLHENAVVGDIHYIQNWSVADNTARDALSVAAADVGKVCQVTGTSSYYLLTDDSPMTWTELGGSGGAGDVVGPASATDNAIVRFDSTTGKLIQNSGITIADGASGTLSNTNSGDVTLNASVADIFGLSTQELTADDPGADRIVFWDDSESKLSHLTAGTNLTITGTTIAATGLTLGTPVASTSGTSIDFTGIPSGVTQINILFEGLSTSGTSIPMIQIGDSGGVELSGYLGSGVTFTGAGNAATLFTTGFGFSGNWSAATVAHGFISISLLDSATFTWVSSSSGGRSDAAGGFAGGGSKSLSAALDRIRITTVGGADTFDAGKVNVSYVL